MKHAELQRLVQEAVCTLTDRQIDLMRAGSNNPQAQIELAGIKGQISALMDVESALNGDDVCLRLLAERGE